MNEADVRLTYRFLAHRNPSHLRILFPDSEVHQFVVASEEEFVHICQKYDGKANLYVGMNDRKGGNKKANITGINAIVIDVDSVRPKDVPATEEERKEALAVAMKIAEYLNSLGRRPFLAMSGNSWHLWMKVDIPVTKENRESLETAIKEFYSSIRSKFETPTVKIDNIGDLPRVIKIIGTKTIKKKEMPARLNRASFWVVKPYDVEVDKDLSEYFLTAPKVPKKDSFSIPSLDLTLDEAERNKYLEVLKVNKKVADLLDGNWRQYNYRSRSEAELALLSLMAKHGIDSKTAYVLMESSKIGKWAECRDAYRQLTLKKAYMEVQKNGRDSVEKDTANDT